jgi:regulator of protease activity HflC (stomatin/prohibitin superfamily)
MLLLKYLLLAAATGLFSGAAAILLYDIYLAFELSRLLRRGAAPPPPARPGRAIRWHTVGKLAAVAWLPLLFSLAIVVVPGGMAGVRVSQISGVRPGTLYPGMHFITPLIDSVALFDVRDHIFTTAAGPTLKAAAPVLTVEAKEGLPIGLAVAVRYRLDPNRLDYIQSNLPQPVDEEIVAPTVSSVFREVAPNYVVREAFSTRREEFRQRAASIITQRLAGDAILVKEVMLREVQLPPEYARGLEGLLEKEQEDERMTVETDIEQKQVRIAELQAEAAKVRQVKRAEADAQARVLAAKAEADSMQYTLPLKQKQIEQTRLEAQARKEATVENAEAEAQAKVIDSKAELERRRMLADAEANRIRVTSAAEAEQMRMEALALKANPLLIQKIIAERLSDKIQIMMVPSDGKFFFASDVLRGAPLAEPNASPSKDASSGTDDPPRKPPGQP